MSEWTQDEVVDTISQIMERAMVDLEFRQLCIDNPEMAVKKITGKELPKGKSVTFVENKGTHQTFILPNLLEDDLQDNKDPDKLPWYCPELNIALKCK